MRTLRLSATLLLVTGCAASQEPEVLELAADTVVARSAGPEAAECRRYVSSRSGDPSEVVKGLKDLDDMREHALVFHSTFEDTGDQRYAAAARQLYASVLEVRPDADVRAYADQLADAPAKSEGRMTKRVARRALRRHLCEVQACYASAVESHPGIFGDVQLYIAVADGRVTELAAHTSDERLADVAACIDRSYRAMTTPRVAAELYYTLALRPAGPTLGDLR